MSISLPNNKTEKLARYNMLVKQGSITIEQAKQAYRDYLKKTQPDWKNDNDGIDWNSGKEPK